MFIFEVLHNIRITINLRTSQNITINYSDGCGNCCNFIGNGDWTDLGDIDCDIEKYIINKRDEKKLSKLVREYELKTIADNLSIKTLDERDIENRTAK